MEYYYYWNIYSSSNSYLLFVSKIKMTKQINKKILFSILAFTSLVLVSAFVIEHQLGHKPCKLCLYERVPYFLSMLLIIKMLFAKKYERVTLLILFLVFISSAALAFYHFGIEQGFFSETLACTVGDLSKALSKEELLEQLQQNSISCKDVSFRILGLSLAAINTIFSLVLSVIFIRMFMNYEKN
jgi:disulfide bond formation protein DsbB